MQITFEVSNFANNPKALVSALYSLKNAGTYFDSANTDITDITCKTPSAAYRYARWISTSGLTAKAERVFLKNPNIGLKYLKLIRKKEFQDADTQKRFWKKIAKDAFLAYTWAHAFQTRLSEAEEEIFIDNVGKAKDYAMFVIKGRFPEKIHNALVLKSFENLTSWQKKSLQEYISYAGK